MKNKIRALTISALVAIILISNGYGKWNDNLKIKGDIRVVADPDVLEAMELQLANLEQQLLEQGLVEQETGLKEEWLPTGTTQDESKFLETNNRSAKDEDEKENLIGDELIESNEEVQGKIKEGKEEGAKKEDILEESEKDSHKPNTVSVNTEKDLTGGTKKGQDKDTYVEKDKESDSITEGKNDDNKLNEGNYGSNN